MIEDSGGASYSRHTLHNSSPPDVSIDTVVKERDKNNKNKNNNNITIWRGSVLTGEEFPPHPGELNHALSQVRGPTQSQLSRCRQDTMEHRLRRKHLLLNPDTNAGKEKKRKNFFFRKNEKMKKNEKNKRK